MSTAPDRAPARTSTDSVGALSQGGETRNASQIGRRAASCWGSIKLPASYSLTPDPSPRGRGETGVGEILAAFGRAAPFRLAVLAVVLLSGCTFFHYLFRMQSPGRVLILELSRLDPAPGAPVDPCDPNAHRSQVKALDKGAMEDFVYGLLNTEIKPAVWRRCAALLLTGLSPELRTELLDQMGFAYRRLLHRSKVETDRREGERLVALHQAYVERPPGTAPTPRIMASLTEDLRRAISEKKLSKRALGFAQDLLETSDEVERGRWKGLTVTKATFDIVPDPIFLPVMRRFARRLPDSDLRQEARRRIIQRNLAASPFPEIKERAKEVTEVVLQKGHNPIDLSAHPPIAAGVDVSLLRIASFVVRQDVAKNRADLLAVIKDPKGEKSVVPPPLPLRGALFFSVRGFTRPIGLCRPQREEDIDLDPSPCMPPSALRSEHPLIALDPDGTAVFQKDLSAEASMRLATSASTFPLLLKAGEVSMTAHGFPLRYMPLEKNDLGLFVFAATQASAPGPSLTVDVNHHIPERLALIVRGAGRTHQAVVERASLPGFLLLSAGAPGGQGSPGVDGVPGVMGQQGTPASCGAFAGSQPIAASDGAPGQQGGEGGAGGRGQNGGDGGEIVVRIFCVNRSCPETQGLLAQVIRSVGGPGGLGGPGGKGGKGGPGGPGGTGQTCSMLVSTGAGAQPAQMALPPGRTGPPGADGPSGQPGPAGEAGRGGAIRFVVPTR